MGGMASEKEKNSLSMKAGPLRQALPWQALIGSNEVWLPATLSERRLRSCCQWWIYQQVPLRSFQWKLCIETFQVYCQYQFLVGESPWIDPVALTIVVVMTIDPVTFFQWHCQY